MKLTREFYIPKDSTEIQHRLGVVYTSDRDGVLIAMGFGGKAQKPTFHYRFKDEERRSKHIAQFFASLEEREARVLSRRVEHKQRQDDGSGPVHHDAASAAKALKAELKAAFPYVKFSVTSSVFAGGDSIDISWDFGPTTKEVEHISKKYQEGWFDGMTDSYNYDQTKVVTELGVIRQLGGAKYVHTNRQYGDTERAVADTLINEFGEKFDRQYDDIQLAWRILSRVSFGPDGFHGVRRSDVVAGQHEEFFEAY